MVFWIGYFIIGFIILVILWRWLGIDWSLESFSTKLLLVATPPFWPLVLIFILAVKFL